MDKKSIIDLSSTILNITLYMSIFSFVGNVVLDLYFNGKVNTKTLIPIILLIVFCIYNKNK